MKKAIYILLASAVIIWALVCLSGCTAKHTQSITSDVAQELLFDSTSYIETVRPDTVRIPGDTVRISTPVYIQCPDGAKPVVKAANALASGKRSEVNVNVDTNGVVTVEARCKEIEEQLYVKDTELQHWRFKYDSMSHVQLTEKRVQVKYVPAIYKWALGWLIICALILIGYIAFQILKRTNIWSQILSKTL